jgi:hypothetical protein
MKIQIQKQENVPHTIQSKTRAANQADVHTVLQKYAKKHVGETLAVAQNNPPPKNIIQGEFRREDEDMLRKIYQAYRRKEIPDVNKLYDYIAKEEIEASYFSDESTLFKGKEWKRKWIKIEKHRRRCRQIVTGKLKVTVIPQEREQKGTKTFDKHLKDGNYFHFLNSNWDHKESKMRIVFNVKKQSALDILSRNLMTLFNDPEVGQQIKEFKIYLKKGEETGIIKKDKAVVYYYSKKGEPDVVGDKIIEQYNSIPEEVRGGALAPFYEKIADGIGRADEPKYYSKDPNMQGSFTNTRAIVIQEILDDMPIISEEQSEEQSEKQFIEKTEEIFKHYGINPQQPYLQYLSREEKEYLCFQNFSDEE